MLLGRFNGQGLNDDYSLLVRETPPQHASAAAEVSEGQSLVYKPSFNVMENLCECNFDNNVKDMKQLQVTVMPRSSMRVNLSSLCCIAAGALRRSVLFIHVTNSDKGVWRCADWRDRARGNRREPHTQRFVNNSILI